jgi:hypothetical protein
MTNRLLMCGIVAGPLFLVAVLVQAATRPGFDLGYHPISLLALGDGGWVQIGAFVLAGSLTVACAAGLRREQGGWGPLLLGVFGAGLVVAGAFVTDAGAGFPPGAPAGAPETSWHGALHNVGFALAVGGMTVGALVLARRFGKAGERGWAAVCVAAAVVPVALGAWPDPDGLSVRLLLATCVQFAFLAALAGRELHVRERAAT